VTKVNIQNIAAAENVRASRKNAVTAEKSRKCAMAGAAEQYTRTPKRKRAPLS